MQKILFNLFNKKSENKTSLDEFNKSYEIEEISTLEGAISSQISLIEKNSKNIFFSLDSSLEFNEEINKFIKSIVFNENELKTTYNTLDVNQYLTLIAPMENTLLLTRDIASNQYKRFMSIYKTHLSSVGKLKSINNTIKKLEHKKMPAQKRFYLEHVKEDNNKIIAQMNKEEQNIQELNSEITLIRDSVNSCLYLIDDLKKNLDLIKSIQGKYSNIDDARVDYELIKLIRGDINRTRAIKNISMLNKPECREQYKEVTQINTTETHIKKEYVVKTQSVEDLAYLNSKGIKNHEAKYLLDNQNIGELKTFINGVETVLELYSIDKKEATNIFQNNPDILNLRNGHKLEYLRTLEMLFDFINPQNSSGITPKHKPSIYTSTESILQFINENKKVNNIKIINLELITNVKDQAVYTEMAKNNNPMFGEFVEKWQTRGFKKQKTNMYSVLSEEFGEGHFRKVKHGSARSNYKLINDQEGNIALLICKYFVNHPEYDKFYKNGK